MCITGALGIPGSGRDRNYTRNSFVSKTYDFNVAVDRSTHVQYTQTDTIRQTDGPLVPMIRLVPIEKHPIPMVLLVNMYLIKRVRLFSHVVWLGKGQFEWFIGTNGTIGTNRK